MTANAFHIESQVCYSTTCNPTEVKWVVDFDGTNGDAYNLIMLVFAVGPRVPGIYVKTPDKIWLLVMPYEVASEIFSTSTHTLKVIFNNTQTVSYDPTTTKVFRTGRLLPTPVIEPSAFDVWAICEGIADAGAVTKATNSTGEGILQISAGPDRSIKDFLPGSAGLVSVDATGVASIVSKIELRSGGGLLIGHILPP